MRTNDFRSDDELYGSDVIDGLLSETRMDLSPDADVLREALRDVRSLGQGPPPVPSGELAALLAVPQTRPGTVSSLQAKRDARRRRVATTAAALSLCLGAGAVAAVASPDFREGVQKSVTALLDTLVPPSRHEDLPVPGHTPDVGLPGADHVPVSPSITSPPVVLPGAAEKQPGSGNTPAVDTPAVGERGPLLPPAPAAPQPVMPPEPAHPGTVPQESSQKDIAPPAPAPAPAPAPDTQPAPRAGRP